MRARAHFNWFGHAIAASTISFSLVACGDDDSSGSSPNAGGAGGGATGGTSSGRGGSSAGTTAVGGNNSAGQGGKSGTGGTSSGGGAAGETAQGGANSNWRFVGRFAHTSSSSRFAWSGSSISTQFTGTALSVELNETQKNGDGHSNYYNVVIDGQVRASKLITDTGKRVYKLAESLTSGTHEVTLHRLTEANQGESEFFGFTLPAGGEFQAYPTKVTRRIEVIGDSISAGYGNEGTDRSCPFTTATENHYLTYAAIAARNLKADLVTVAWSGKGLESNRGAEPGPSTPADELITMPTLWERTLPARSDSKWEFSGYQPDAVVINLGTNDFVAENKDWPAFEPAFLNFVKAVRSRYAAADIFCALGPMLFGDGLTTAKKYVDGAVKSLTTQGDAKVHLIEFDQQGANGYGCDWHPNLKEHQNMATKLEAAIKAQLKW